MVDIVNNPKQRQIVSETIERSKRFDDPVKWFMGYYTARDFQENHESAMDLADRFMQTSLAELEREIV